ncbi:nitrate/nitrite transporter [Schinkia azotoformans]|uniref:nitrate/nitrite transporter n=1 Tax=Schinkia azotoformans TaxID=1454 RepID=UPI002DBB5E8E|nr:nitrate/nitrite transporter [Schinkia azotoformans]MEC1694662.1 NarK/NasA family nitrate transporter [Schinkia azotoformans]
MSNLKDFFKSGHLPTLISSFLYFDISFMIWVIVGATSTFIVQDFGLSPVEKGLMVGIPVLGGSLLRIPMGLLADRFGGKRMGIIGMLLTMIPLFWGWLYGNSLTEVQAFGFLLGIAGASFAVALPLASRWYPPKHQGLAMGITGAGNSGTALATLFAPRIAEAFGWHAVFGFALIPLAVAFIFFIVFAKESPTSPKPQKLSEYLAIVKVKETWIFSFFYSLSFGGFVGLTSYLGIFFVDQYGVNKVTAGDFVTLTVFAGSFVRPIGGYIADRLGGMSLLIKLFLLAAVVLDLIGILPSVYIALALFIIAMMIFGIANGALFQVIPTRFPKEVGIVTGFVGAAGGLGGFFLPNILGTFKEITGTYAFGFWWIGTTYLVALAMLVWLKNSWKRNKNRVEESVLDENAI